jgi:F-type H+-transporting ATPase subunit alpha
VGSAAQIKAIKQVAGKIKLELAQFRELAAFAQFASDLDAATKAKLDRGARIVEIFKQTQYKPLPVELQVAILWSVQNGFFDAVPVDKVKAFQNRLSEYLTTRKENILSGIREKKAVDDALGGELKSALNDFVASQPTA